MADDDRLLRALAAQLGLLEPDSEQSRFLAEVSERLVALHGSPEAALAHLPPLGPLEDTLPAAPAGSGTEERVCREVSGRYDFATGEGGRPEELGRGGMGRVLSVMDRFMGREVALKQLLQRGDEGLEGRFLREARVTAQLQHPAILPVYEIGRRADESLYYTMQRIRGRTLARAIQEAASIDERLLLLPHVLGVCQAVAFAHSRKVMHRDLKPLNVMIGSFGETSLLDWGLARIDGNTELTKLEPESLAARSPALTVGPVGTPAYMSPEQAAGTGALDDRSDVWGLGAILYEVLTGRPPFVGSTPYEVLTRVQADALTPVLQLEPAAPADLAAICEKALRKKPEERYATAADLTDDLSRWLAGRRVGAYDYSSLELLRRFARQNRRPLAVALVALIALLVLSGVAVQRVRVERNEARQFAQLLVGDVASKLGGVAGARPLIDQLTRSAFDFFERTEDVSALSVEERATRADAWMRLAALNRNEARFDEARKCFDKCFALTAEARQSTTPSFELYSRSIECEIALYDLERMQGQAELARAHALRLWAEVEPLSERWPAQPLWLAAMADVASRLSDAEVVAGNDEAALPLLERALTFEEKAYALAPDSESVRRNFALVLRDASLRTWDAEHPERSASLGDRAVTAARRELTLTNVRSLANTGSVLRQQAMLLGWTARAKESAALYAEGQRLLEKALVLDPNDLQALGELGDLALENGDPERAWEVLSRAASLGAAGDYTASLCLAELLSHRFDALVARAVEVEKSEDAQSQLAVGLALSLTKEPGAGVKLIRLAASRVKSDQLQWPRGAIHRLGEQQGGAVGAAIVRFADAFEPAFVGKDDEPRVAAFEQLAADLEALTPKR